MHARIRLFLPVLAILFTFYPFFATADIPVGKSGYSVELITDEVIHPSSGLVLWEGDLFTAEGFWPGFSNQPIVQISPAAPAGTKTTYGTPGEELNQPDELAFRSDGVLFVVERYSDTPGIYTIAPGGGSASLFIDYDTGGFNYPTGIAFGPDGYLYVQDTSSDSKWGFVKKFDPSSPGGPLETLLDPFEGPGTHGTVLEGIAFSNGGKMFMARQDISQVDVYDPATQTWGNINSVLFDEAIGIAVGPDLLGMGEFIYLANWHTVTRSTLDGSNTVEIASGLLNGMGVAVDSWGTVFVGDNEGGAIYAVTPEPASLTLGLIGLGYTSWRLRRRKALR